jgi:hypothetical protein
MKIDLFEIHDIALHRLMLWSHKKYRNAVKKMCFKDGFIRDIDNRYCDWLYQLYVLAKNVYMGHVRKPRKGHILFLITMDEVFNNTKVLKVLWPKLRMKIGMKHGEPPQRS